MLFDWNDWGPSPLVICPCCINFPFFLQLPKPMKGMTGSQADTDCQTVLFIFILYSPDLASVFGWLDQRILLPDKPDPLALNTSIASQSSAPEEDNIVVTDARVVQLLRFCCWFSFLWYPFADKQFQVVHLCVIKAGTGMTNCNALGKPTVVTPPPLSLASARATYRYVV